MAFWIKQKRFAQKRKQHDRLPIKESNGAGAPRHPNNPGADAGARVDELDALMAEDTDTVYEHEVVTTVRITVRSLSPYLDKAAFLEDYAYLTEFSLFTESDDYPRIVATSVVDDEVEYFDKEINDE